MRLSENSWVWMPHPAHFIGHRNCQFRLATYVGGYVVSTIGEYLPHSEQVGTEWEQIGAGRLYETFVFPAERSSNGACPACQYMPSDWSERDSLAANDAKTAYENHLKLCRKWAKKEASA